MIPTRVNLTKRELHMSSETKSVFFFVCAKVRLSAVRLTVMAFSF